MKKCALGICCLFLIVAQLSGQGLQEGLVFYAPFDGSTVNLVGWVKPINQGASLVADKFGRPDRAIAFDGENDLLNYGNIVQLGKNNFSVSLWVKADGFYTGIRYGQSAKIMNKGLTGSGGRELNGFGVRAVRFDDSGNNFRFMTADGSFEDRSSALQFTDKFGVDDQQWYHLVLTRSGSQTQLYLDGQLVVTGIGAGSADLSTDHPFTLGGMLAANGVDASEFFHGQLDEVRIYNRRLSQRDIGLLYAQFVGDEALSNAPPAALRRESAIELSTFPNPATRILNVDFTSEADRRLEVVDGAGRNMFYGRFNGARASVNVAGLPPGTYYLKVREGDRQVVRKFIKQGTVLP